MPKKLFFFMITFVLVISSCKTMTLKITDDIEKYDTLIVYKIDNKDNYTVYFGYEDIGAYKNISSRSVKPNLPPYTIVQATSKEKQYSIYRIAFADAHSNIQTKKFDANPNDIIWAGNFKVYANSKNKMAFSFQLEPSENEYEDVLKYISENYPLEYWRKIAKEKLESIEVEQ
jgi:hypothetical protein